MHSQNDVTGLYICALVQSAGETMSNPDIHQSYLAGSLKVARQQREEATTLLRAWLTQPGENLHAASEIDRIARRLGVAESRRNSLAMYRWGIFGQSNAPREFALLITEVDLHLFDPRKASASSGNAVQTAVTALRPPLFANRHWFTTTGPLDYTTEHRLVEVSDQDAVTWLAGHLPIALFQKRVEQADFVRRYAELHPTNNLIDVQEAQRLHADAKTILRNAKTAVARYGSSRAQETITEEK